MIGIGKAAVDPPKERMRGKEVDFGHSYQLIDVNVLMVHEIANKRHTNNTAISQYFCEYVTNTYRGIEHG